MIKEKAVPKKVPAAVQNKQGAQSKRFLHQQKSFKDNPAVLLVIILAITFIAFLPSLFNQFISTWDDNVYITDNKLITQLNWERLKDFFTTQVNGTYVPIPLLSWALEFKLFGLHPFPYHLDNLLLHLLCTSLVFYFFILLRIPLLYAAFGALLFGIHPMRVESVAWVTERKDLLFCLFYVGSLMMYCKYIVSEKERPKYFLLTLLLFVLSLFSKIQAVSLPLAIILLDYWFARPLNWKLILEKVPFFLLSLGFGITGYSILQHLQVININDKYSLFERILFGLYSLSAYMFKLILPVKLSIYYPYPVEPGQSLPILYYLNLVFLIAMAVLIFLTVRKTKAIVFGSLFFLFNVMFLLQIVRAGNAYQADRFTYVSYIGLFFIIVWGANKFTDRYKERKMLIPVLTIVMTVFFFFTTYARCKDWKDSITLWGDVISKYDHAKLAYYNRGVIYGELGKWEDAIADYTKAIQANPAYIIAYNNRGNAFGKLGQWDKTITDCSEMIRLDPKNETGWYNRGFAYANLTQWDKAIADYSRAIELEPNFKDAWNDRGFSYANLGKLDLAIADYSKAIRIDTNCIQAYANRGNAYGKLGQWDKTLADCSKMIVIDPKYAPAWYNQGIAFANLGQWEKAIADYSRAIELDPNFTNAYRARDFAYTKLNNGKKR